MQRIYRYLGEGEKSTASRTQPGRNASTPGDNAEAHWPEKVLVPRSDERRTHALSTTWLSSTARAADPPRRARPTTHPWQAIDGHANAAGAVHCKPRVWRDL